MRQTAADRWLQGCIGIYIAIYTQAFHKIFKISENDIYIYPYFFFRRLRRRFIQFIFIFDVYYGFRMGLESLSRRRRKFWRSWYRLKHFFIVETAFSTAEIPNFRLRRAIKTIYIKGEPLGSRHPKCWTVVQLMWNSFLKLLISMCVCVCVAQENCKNQSWSSVCVLRKR